jgi:hypothetical protein
MRNALVVCFSLVFVQMSFAQTKVAVVKLLRGEVSAINVGKTTPLKVDDWVEEGMIVKTEEKSFVKLVFVDKSQMNVGPNSEMKIENFSGKDSGVIDLVKGKIRSQVTKDYLQIQDKDKSKVFIKTQNAVMGVRGTDFMITTNGASTSTILFEGEVVFNKLPERTSSPAQLEQIVNNGVRIFPGEFSVMDQSRPMPTVPALLNIQQREKLEKNTEFNSDRTPSNTAKVQSSKSMIPEGLNGKLIANNSDVLKKEVSQVEQVNTTANRSPSSSDPEGYVKGELVKPANGSFVHIESGVIVPPAGDSVLDTNTNTFIPTQSAGEVAANGEYVPPQNVEITNDGKILVKVVDNGQTIVKEVAPPAPVISNEEVFKGASGGAIVAQAPAPAPAHNDILNTPGSTADFRPPPTGGVAGINDPAVKLSGGKVPTTIIVKPQ